jgi:hypothetical protein
MEGKLYFTSPALTLTDKHDRDWNSRCSEQGVFVWEIFNPQIIFEQNDLESGATIPIFHWSLAKHIC